jgi:phospholipid/cholesterol/gamma-HCH transport system substrate-binding protein
MASKKGVGQTIRTGIFVVFGFLVFVGALFVLGARKQLFSEMYKISATYTDVAGLQEGAFVRIAGINVGSVAKIDLPGAGVDRVRVTFKIRGDARHLIRKGSKAIIDTEGLLGSMIVIITQGSPDSAIVLAGEAIPGQSPIEMRRFSQNIDRVLGNLDLVLVGGADVLHTSREILDKVNRGEGSIGALVNSSTLHDTVIFTVGQIRRLLATADGTLRGVQGSVASVAGSVDRTLQHYSAAADTLRDVGSEFRLAGRNTNAIIRDLQMGKGTLGRLMTDDSAYVALNRTLASSDSMVHHGSEAIGEISRAAGAIAQSAEQTRVTIDRVSQNVMRGQGTVGRLLNDDSIYVKLDRVLANLDISSQKMAVNMEAMRTNWLFRGYFEDAGYWRDTERNIQLIEQRNIRLNEWERRLQRLQAQLGAQESALDANRQRPTRSMTTPPDTSRRAPGSVQEK